VKILTKTVPLLRSSALLLSRLIVVSVLGRNDGGHTMRSFKQMGCRMNPKSYGDYEALKPGASKWFDLRICFVCNFRRLPHAGLRLRIIPYIQSKA
jgi:hypothetical protein